MKLVVVLYLSMIHLFGYGQMGRYYDDESDDFKWDFKAFVILGIIILIGRYIINRSNSRDSKNVLPITKESEKITKKPSSFYTFIFLWDNMPCRISSTGLSLDEAMNKSHIREYYLDEKSDFLFYKKNENVKLEYSEDVFEIPPSKSPDRILVEYWRTHGWSDFTESQFLAQYDFNNEISSEFNAFESSKTGIFTELLAEIKGVSDEIPEKAIQIFTNEEYAYYRSFEYLRDLTEDIDDVRCFSDASHFRPSLEEIKDDEIQFIKDQTQRLTDLNRFREFKFDEQGLNRMGHGTLKHVKQEVSQSLYCLEQTLSTLR